MIRSVALPLALLLTLVGVSAADDFRESSWGDTKESVREVEKSPLHHELDDELAYFSNEIPGIEGGLKYLFVGGRLAKGIFLSRNGRTTYEAAHTDYLAMQRYFDEKLGPHTKEEWVWSDETPEPDESLWSDALVAGRVKLVTDWELENGSARQVLSGRDGRLRLRTTFTPGRP